MRETDNTDVPGKRARWRVQSHPETPQSTGSARHWRRCSRNPCSAREIRSYIRILPGSASALQGTLLPCERGAVFPALRSMGCRGFPLCGRGAAHFAGARKMGPRPTSRYQRPRASCNRRAIPLSRWMACNRREMTWRSAPSWTCRKSDADTPRPLAHRRTSRKVITLRGDERVLRYFLLGKLIEILDSLPHQAHDLLAA